MSDLQKYISKRKKQDPDFAADYEIGYEQFRLGVLLRQAREDAGLTQEELARRMNTKKSAISRIENHAEDIKLSTLEKFAQAIGKTLRLRVALVSIERTKGSPRTNKRLRFSLDGHPWRSVGNIAAILSDTDLHSPAVGRNHKEN